jgi:murein peptide amidase A
MSEVSQSYLRHHRAHDVDALLACWQEVVPHEGWQMGIFAHAGDHPLLLIESEVFTGPRFYVSAGVHGDEAAPPWALLEWFVENLDTLSKYPVSLVPCFNPHGLAANTRTNEHGEDLNRSFHQEDHPIIGPWREVMQERSIGMAVMLHEDYDAQGIYTYEIHAPRQKPICDSLLKTAEKIIPRDLRRDIDGRAFKKGVFTRDELPTDVPGDPEAFALHRFGAEYNLTFETPSEYSLFDRVCAHKAYLSAAWAVAQKGKR